MPVEFEFHFEKSCDAAAVNTDRDQIDLKTELRLENFS